VIGARVWHDAGGAAHSIGDSAVAVVISGAAFGIGYLYAKTEKARPLLVDIAAGVGAAAGTASVVGYADSLGPAFFTWLAASTCGLIINGRRQRKERHRWENMLAQDRREQRDAETRIRLREIARREREAIAREMGPALAAQQVAQANRPIVQLITPAGGVPFPMTPNLAELLSSGDRVVGAVDSRAEVLDAEEVEEHQERDEAGGLPSWISRGTATQDQAS